MKGPSLPITEGASYNYGMQGGDIHGIQAGILRQLFYKDGLRFAEINVDDISSDHFSYHLRQLVKHGLVDKSADNTYSLSVLGRTRTIMLYPNKNGFIEQGFLAVRIVLSKDENGKRYYLMQDRDAVPYTGTLGTPGDKILFGEDVQDAAQRSMEASTGLSCKLRLCGLVHTKDDYKDKIVQDKYFFVVAGHNPQGELKERGRSGNNIWMTRAELIESGRSIQGGLDIIDVAESSDWQFREKTLKIEKY